MTEEWPLVRSERRKPKKLFENLPQPVFVPEGLLIIARSFDTMNRAPAARAQARKISSLASLSPHLTWACWWAGHNPCANKGTRGSRV